MVGPIEAAFPGLRTSSFHITSPATRKYNCVAWAAGDTEHWWWPDPDNEAAFWPSGVPIEETVDAFVSAFATLGYSLCQDEFLEPGLEKVALFTAEATPTHAARQLPNGRWSSKLGFQEDIEHELHALNGEVYGGVRLLLKRPSPANSKTG